MHSTHYRSFQGLVQHRVVWVLVLLCSFSVLANADSASATHTPSKQGKLEEEQATARSAKEMGDKVREAIGGNVVNKKLTLIMNGKAVVPEESPAVGANAPAKPAVAVAHHAPAAKPVAVAHASLPSKPGIAAPVQEAAVHGGDVHWAYDGENGPSAWGKLKPEFNVCALGKRQSPIPIEDGNTLQGPAEPIRFNYTPSGATVVNNGHTIQVDVQGDNAITVRGTSYQLLQFHFHTPSEEQVNFKRSAMVAHLVHKNAEGQLAVVAVLLEIGNANPLIDKVWTYMPLDANDRVRMPRELLNLNELLPADQRYYQFMGSLTTPPCSEGVLWMVLKSPMQISKAQYKLFTQLYANNARPLQPLNGRPVREAQ